MRPGTRAAQRGLPPRSGSEISGTVLGNRQEPAAAMLRCNGRVGLAWRSPEPAMPSERGGDGNE